MRLIDTTPAAAPDLEQRKRLSDRFSFGVGQGLGELLHAHRAERPPAALLLVDQPPGLDKDPLGHIQYSFFRL